MPANEILTINPEPAINWAERNVAPFVSASTSQDRHDAFTSPLFLDKPFLPRACQQCRHRITRRGHKQHDWKPCTESQQGG